jgi:transposase
MSRRVYVADALDNGAGFAVEIGQKEIFEQLLKQIAEGIAPHLQDMSGVGPASAAQVIISWSYPGRCRNEAAFASLAGVSPIPASSGQTTRYRLNRGRDPALNRALHDITITRWRMCPRTHTYINRRRAEGKTDREIRRCLKRYIARQIHRELTNARA